MAKRRFQIPIEHYVYKGVLMGLDEQFDSVTAESLRAAGSKKWSTYPDTIGAFVAEMDFGTAPAVKTALERAIDVEQLG